MAFRSPLILFAAVWAMVDGSTAFADLPTDGADLSGLYAGSYLCSDGEHGVILDLSFAPRETGDGLDVFGMLGFVPVLAGLDGPAGQAAGIFKVAGAAYPDGRIVLQPGEWIVRPDGYGAAGLDATLSLHEDGLWRIEGAPIAGPDQCSALIAVKPFG